MQRRAAFCRDRFQHRQGFEGFARIDHGGPMGDAGEIPQHHTETVIEWHRNAQPITGGQLDSFPNKEAIVQQVMVGQGGSLGAPVVPLVN